MVERPGSNLGAHPIVATQKATVLCRLAGTALGAKNKLKPAVATDKQNTMNCDLCEVQGGVYI